MRPIVVGLTVVAGIAVLVALITVPVLMSGHRVSRVEGGAFVAADLGYLAWVILG